MSKNDMIDSSHVNRGQRPDYLGKEAFVFMNDSLQYYNQHAKEFSDSTRDVEFKEMQERFLVYLKPGAESWISGAAPAEIRSISWTGDLRRMPRMVRKNWSG